MSRCALSVERSCRRLGVHTRLGGGPATPPSLVTSNASLDRVRLVGALEQFGMLEHPKMRESILVALRASRIARAASPRLRQYWRCCLLSQKTRRAYCDSACLRRRAHILINFEHSACLTTTLNEYTHVTKEKRSRGVPSAAPADDRCKKLNILSFALASDARDRTQRYISQRDCPPSPPALLTQDSMPRERRHLAGGTREGGSG